ncbi:hypothetical protein GCM10023087_22620 [Microbacterium rhizosphaerae]
MQLLDALVADEVRPQASVRRPAGVVDEDGHAPILGGAGDAEGGTARRNPALLPGGGASGKVFLWCVRPRDCGRRPSPNESLCDPELGRTRTSRLPRQFGALGSQTKQV